MFAFALKKMRFALNKGRSKTESSCNSTHVLSKALCENLAAIKAATNNSSDIVIRQFSFSEYGTLNAALIYTDGLTDSKTINRSIVEPLMNAASTDLIECIRKNSLLTIESTVLTVGEVDETCTLDNAIEAFLSGNAVLLIDGISSACMINCKGWEKRSISEPSSESVIRGPRESFTESIRTNTALLRRKIKNPDLVFEALKLGQRTRTTVCISYIKGVANTELINDVRTRLNSIITDSILESGYIEQYIEDAPFSLFSTVGNTEKPDVAAAKLLEGRVAILVDGTPNILTAPMLFIESFQSAEDYYSRPYFMSMLRMVRYVAFFTNLIVPAAFVAITTYHHELIPTTLLMTMAKAREGVPFPAALESIIMLTAFEILREAGVRLPRPIGQAMSIVGALVMGEAAVSAGLISAPMVIVVAITAVSIFAVPNQADAAAIIRFIMIVLAATMGNFGVTIGVLGVLIHLSSLKSFGFPYLSPIVPLQKGAEKDSLVRAPLWSMVRRPKGMALQDKKRRAYNPPTESSDYNSEAN